MEEKRNPGLIEGLESVESEIPIEGPPGAPDSLEKMYKVIETQSNALILLTGKLAEMTTSLEALESHQDQSDAAIIEVAKKVGGGGGGGGGGGNLLAQILPYLTQPRGPSPLEKVAQSMFIRNLSFSTLVTDRLAKKQFGDEYTKMVKEMEADLSGKKGEGS
jgi:hypothetical protein